MTVGRINHHATVYGCAENSKTNVFLPAHSRTNLGHFSFSRHHIQQFSLPYHALTLDRINPTGGRGRYHWQNHLPSQPILLPSTEVSWPSGNCPNHPSTLVPFAGEPPPTDLHTGSRRDSLPILDNLPTQTSSTAPTPNLTSSARAS